MKKLSDMLKKFYLNFCSYVCSNRLFLSFFFLSIIGCILTRSLTIGNSLFFRSLVVEIGLILIIGSFCYLKKPQNQYHYLIIWICFFSFLFVTHTIYYRFYTSFGSAGDLATLRQAETVTGSILDKLSIMNIIFVLIPIIFHHIHNKLKTSSYYNFLKKVENSKKLFIITFITGLSLIGIRFIFATKADYNSLKTQWNRSSVVSRFGILFYQGNDIFQLLKPKINSIFGHDEALKIVQDYYNSDISKKYQGTNKYTGILEKKNIVFVHMESMQNFLMDLSFNGKEVTPNLNKLAKEGMFFSNFYPEIATGTSSDTEFTNLSSLMPVASGTVFVSYYNRKYVTTASLLSEKGYKTFSMHGNLASMWNRSKIHPILGYQDMYFQESFEYTDDDVINLGINDKLFFKQAMPILEDIEKNNENYMGTVITLSNHSPFSSLSKYGDYDLSSTFKNKEGQTVTTNYLEGTAVGNYIHSSHYADDALGDFIDYIKKSDYFNNTVFVFYGDHDAKLSKNEMNYLYNYNKEDGSLYEQDDIEYQSYDQFDHELNKKTPLIIWTKNKALKNKLHGTYNYYMGMIDLQPTILNMLNMSNKYALGHDIFNIKNNNVIPFPNGNFVSNTMYYNNSTGEFKIFNSNTVIDLSYIEEKSKYVEDILNISNYIIVYDILSDME